MNKDDTHYRTRTEIKNLNSIRSMARAIAYEAKRQIKLYESGDTVKQATLGWDENKQRIVIQRYKERADEYRYFPEPDLPIVHITREQVAEVQAKLPELPDAKQARFVDTLNLTPYDARVLTMEKAVADYYEAALDTGADPKATANWMLTSLFGLFNKESVNRESVNDTSVSAQNLGELVKLVTSGKLNKGSGEKALMAMWETGDDPATVVEREGLAQVSDEGLIGEKIDETLAQNAALVEQYLGGKEKVFGALMGKSMGALKGKGNPQVVKEILLGKLDAMK